MLNGNGAIRLFSGEGNTSLNHPSTDEEITIDRDILREINRFNDYHNKTKEYAIMCRGLISIAEVKIEKALWNKRCGKYGSSILPIIAASYATDCLPSYRSVGKNPTSGGRSTISPAMLLMTGYLECEYPSCS